MSKSFFINPLNAGVGLILRAKKLSGSSLGTIDYGKVIIQATAQQRRPSKINRPLHIWSDDRPGLHAMSRTDSLTAAALVHRTSQPPVLPTSYLHSKKLARPRCTFYCFLGPRPGGGGGYNLEPRPQPTANRRLDLASTSTGTL